MPLKVRIHPASLISLIAILLSFLSIGCPYYQRYKERKWEEKEQAQLDSVTRLGHRIDAWNEELRRRAIAVNRFGTHARWDSICKLYDSMYPEEHLPHLVPPLPDPYDAKEERSRDSINQERIDSLRSCLHLIHGRGWLTTRHGDTVWFPIKDGKGDTNILFKGKGYQLKINHLPKGAYSLKPWGLDSSAVSSTGIYHRVLPSLSANPTISPGRITNRTTHTGSPSKPEPFRLKQIGFYKTNIRLYHDTLLIRPGGRNKNEEGEIGNTPDPWALIFNGSSTLYNLHKANTRLDTIIAKLEKRPKCPWRVCNYDDSLMKDFNFYIRYQMPWMPGGGEIISRVLRRIPEDSMKVWIGKKTWDSLEQH